MSFEILGATFTAIKLKGSEESFIVDMLVFLCDKNI